MTQRPLATRVATALVVIAVVICAILLAPSWGLAIFAGLIGSVLFYEIGKLFYVRSSSKTKQLIPVFFVFGFAIFLIAVNPLIARNPWTLSLVSVSLWFFLLITIWYGNWGMSSLWKAVKCLWILFAIGASLICATVFFKIVGPHGLIYVIAVVSVVDSGAFFVGKAIGRTKFAPTISPNKTWEGTIGGVISGYALCGIVTIFDLQIANIENLWLFTTLVIPLGILGDLFESSLKRTAGLSESGTLLPGHGGVFDRLDSLLPVLPVALLYSLP